MCDTKYIFREFIRFCCTIIFVKFQILNLQNILLGSQYYRRKLCLRQKFKNLMINESEKNPMVCQRIHYGRYHFTRYLLFKQIFEQTSIQAYQMIDEYHPPTPDTMATGIGAVKCFPRFYLRLVFPFSRVDSVSGGNVQGSILNLMMQLVAT